MIDLDTFIESMQDLKTMRPTEISEILKRRSGNSIEMQNIVKMIIKNGKIFNEICCFVLFVFFFHIPIYNVVFLCHSFISIIRHYHIYTCV